MTTTGPRTGDFRDQLVQPVLVLGVTAVGAVQWSAGQTVFPAVALSLFVLAALAGISTLFPWTGLGPRTQIAVISAYMGFGALLLPLAHETQAAGIFPFIAASAAGVKLASRKAAVGIAVGGALLATGASWAVGALVPSAPQWPWWAPLTVALPVYMGISFRDRQDVLLSARRAAEAAERAAESEAREAALLERARIGREVHDVLGHSLSGIALQLDLADALRDSGRDEESVAAVRRARALAVDSIGETRRAVQALREDTLPLPDLLRRLAERNAVDFTIAGEPASPGAEATHAVFRVAQEALTNAAKHAPGATRAMSLSGTADRIILTVHNGPAGDARHGGTAATPGVGLVGMRERAAQLDATLHAGLAPDGGWTVELSLPRHSV
ncbi:sensor histidine kinase [Amycolatopsis saalfeldensis]|uniref:histidine kinase n=1 Tax=Amycolatopsis saalfeldensis TaxID=394193 RepID=A0A1H8XHR8_9PSEU|nr:histidine kinase [Amycolatopsis saalfeldensis]SEP39540.1 Signal transduction histidine kinase [Amycolatopsis saalfeldensis]